MAKASKKMKQEIMPRGERMRVKVEKIYRNRWNPNEMTVQMQKKVAKSLERFGFLGEVLVREVGPKFPEGAGRSDRSGYEIINGEHRFTEAKKAGLKEVDVRNLGKVRDSEAQQLTVVMNGLTGIPDPEALAKLLVQVTKETPADILAEVMPYQRSDIEGLVRLADVDPYFDKDPSSRITDTDEWKNTDVVKVSFDVWKGDVPIATAREVLKVLDRIAGLVHTNDTVAIVRKFTRLAAEGIESIAWDKLLSEEEA